MLKQKSKSSQLKSAAVGILLIAIVASGMYSIRVSPNVESSNLGVSGCPSAPGGQPTPNSTASKLQSCTLPQTCSPPVITWHGVKTIQGYRQVWVNWSDTGGVTSREFQWGTSTNYGFAVPQLNGADVNLNDMLASTTYYYKITDWSGYCSASVTDSFTSASAQTSGFVGWVSAFTPDSYQLNQVGSSVLGGASVLVGARCYGNLNYPGQLTYFRAATTDSGGQYSFSFPLSINYGVYSITLSSNGQCSEVYSWQTVSNQYYLLNAGLSGYWNATQWVSSTLSSPNDFRQFGLEKNGVDFAPSVIAFVHTGYADCSVSIQNSFSQTVDAYLGGNGYTDQAQGGNYGSVDGGPGSESEINYHYTTTGVANETVGVIDSNTYAVGNPVGPELNGYIYTDPLSSPPATDAAHTITIGHSTSNNYGWYNGGSYTAQTGLDITVSLSGVWGGSAISPGASVDLSYTTSMGVSNTKSINCVFTGFTQTENIQFYFWQDGGSPSNQQAVNLHIWYDDMCPINTC
jgi:hypothetical protein